MSANALPISSARFATALRELPISSLHAKVAELRNSIAHLEKSNKDLEEYVREEDDKDCYEALMENKQVIERNKERIELIKVEVTELRGLAWAEGEGKTVVKEEGDQNTTTGNDNASTVTQQNGTGVNVNGHAGGQENSVSAPEVEEGVFL